MGLEGDGHGSSDAPRLGSLSPVGEAMQEPFAFPRGE
jgi:hypothetical protein